MNPKSHPRYESLRIRDLTVKGIMKGITSMQGLVAHGRGEALDYLLGERTLPVAKKSIESAAALLLIAKNPVISVNGNSAILVPKELVKLSKIIPAKLEVNIFHPSKKREFKIKNYLIKNGSKEVLLPQKKFKIKHLDSNRKYVNKDGIYKADVVFIPLEDGDRTEALRRNGKKVIVVDLNPLCRSAQKANLSIIDNIVRVMPLLIKTIMKLKEYKLSKKQLNVIYKHHNNGKRLKIALQKIKKL